MKVVMYDRFHCDSYQGIRDSVQQYVGEGKAKIIGSHPLKRGNRHIYLSETLSMEAKFNTNNITKVAPTPPLMSIYECFSLYISCCLIESLCRDLYVVHL